MAIRVRTRDAQGQLATLLRADARDAAGRDGIVSRADQPRLGPYLAERAEAIRRERKGARISVDTLVARGMTDAMQTWNAFNPPANHANHRWLSQSEIRAIGRADPHLGALTTTAYESAKRLAPSADDALIPDVALGAGTHPGITLTRNGDVFTLHATPEVPQATAFTLSVDGRAFELRRLAHGFTTFQLNGEMPEGYSAEHIGNAVVRGQTTSTFRVRKDPPGSLTSGQALVRARAALLEYMRDERIHQRDWQDSIGWTWDEAVARGVLDQIARFGADDPREGSGVVRNPDSYTFVGRGPADLYTEVTVRKRDGDVTNVYVEID